MWWLRTLQSYWVLSPVWFWWLLDKLPYWIHLPLKWYQQCGLQFINSPVPGFYIMRQNIILQQLEGPLTTTRGRSGWVVKLNVLNVPRWKYSLCARLFKNSLSSPNRDVYLTLLRAVKVERKRSGAPPHLSYTVIGTSSFSNSHFPARSLAEGQQLSLSVVLKTNSIKDQCRWRSSTEVKNPQRVSNFYLRCEWITPWWKPLGRAYSVHTPGMARMNWIGWNRRSLWTLCSLK